MTIFIALLVLLTGWLGYRLYRDATTWHEVGSGRIARHIREENTCEGWPYPMSERTVIVTIDTIIMENGREFAGEFINDPRVGENVVVERNGNGKYRTIVKP